MNETTNDIACLDWFEVARLKDGGFVAFHLDNYGSKRKPVFSCTSMVELTDYLTKNMDPEGYERSMQEEVYQAISGKKKD